MKKEYDTSVKEAIERVMSVFSEYIKTTPYFDIVWSGKVGYIYISIDSCRGTVGDMDCLVIDSPEELLDKLLYRNGSGYHGGRWARPKPGRSVSIGAC